MDLPSIQALMRYWRGCPPIHRLAAWHWQYKAPAAEPVGTSAQTEESLRSAAEYGMPVQTIPAAEYDQHLKDLGIAS